MVCRRGKFGFNTGNTVRSFDRLLNCPKVLSTQLISVAPGRVVSDSQIVCAVFQLTPYVSYSANRKSRWRLAEIVAERYKQYCYKDWDFAEEKICLITAAQSFWKKNKTTPVRSDYYYFSSRPDQSAQITRFGPVRSQIENIQVAEYSHKFDKKNRRLVRKSGHGKAFCHQCKEETCPICVDKCPAYDETKYLLDVPSTTFQLSLTSKALHQKRKHHAKLSEFQPKHLRNTTTDEKPQIPLPTYQLRPKSDKFQHYWFLVEVTDVEYFTDTFQNFPLNISFLFRPQLAYDKDFAAQQLKKMYKNQMSLTVAGELQSV